MHKNARNKNKWHALCSRKKAKALSVFSKINWHALCSGAVFHFERSETSVNYERSEGVGERSDHVGDRAERVMFSPPRSGTGRAERGSGGAERPRTQYAVI